MCDGSIASGAPPISISGNQYIIPTVPRDSVATQNAISAGAAKNTGATQPVPPPNDPNLGKHLDVSA